MTNDSRLDVDRHWSRRIKLCMIQREQLQIDEKASRKEKRMASRYHLIFGITEEL